MNRKEMGQQAGLICRQCGCSHFLVTHTERLTNGTIRRRRECRHCGKKIVSVEHTVAETVTPKSQKRTR